MPLPSSAELFFGLRLTDEQRKMVDSIFDYQVTIIEAPAGTGKTTLAVAAAKIISKPLIYVFSPVEEGKMGFRPGEQNEKEDAYIQPLRDALIEIGERPDDSIFQPKLTAHFNKSAWVFPRSHIFARGSNYKNSTVVLDECQNMTVSEIRKILTRCHDNCKVIMIGNHKQIDINPKDSGFAHAMDYFKTKPYVNVCELTKVFRGQLAADADLM